MNTLTFTASVGPAMPQGTGLILGAPNVVGRQLNLATLPRLLSGPRKKNKFCYPRLILLHTRKALKVDRTDDLPIQHGNFPWLC